MPALQIATWWAEGPWGLKQVVAGLADDWLSWSTGQGWLTIVMKHRSGKCNSLQESLVHCRPCHLWRHPLSLASDLKTQVAESARCNVTGAKQEAFSIQVPATLGSWGRGGWRPPTLPPIQCLAPHCIQGQPHALCPSEVALHHSDQPPLFPLSLCYFMANSHHEFEALFLLHCWVPTGLFRFPVTPNIHHHDVLWEPWPVFCTEAKQHPDEKRTWTTNGLKQFAIETTWELPR